jgi:hypothetical protein
MSYSWKECQPAERIRRRGSINQDLSKMFDVQWFSCKCQEYACNTVKTDIISRVLSLMWLLHTAEYFISSLLGFSLSLSLTLSWDSPVFCYIRVARHATQCYIFLENPKVFQSYAVLEFQTNHERGIQRVRKPLLLY